MEMNIDIKKGLGSLRFHTPIEEVVALMGQPTKVETIDNVIDETTTIMRYEALRLTLFFEGENPQLECIDISNPNSRLFEQTIFDLNERAITNLMVKYNYTEQDVDTESWGERRISFPEGNIDFYLDNDKLVSISFGS